jgi:hypothetical protein
LGVAGGAFSVYELGTGLASGNQEQVFNGAYGGAALFLGLAQPGLGIGMGIAILVDQLLQEPSPANILDVINADNTSGCP